MTTFNCGVPVVGNGGTLEDDCDEDCYHESSVEDYECQNRVLHCSSVACQTKKEYEDRVLNDCKNRVIEDLDGIVVLLLE